MILFVWIGIVVWCFWLVNFHVAIIFVWRMVCLQYIQLVELGTFAMSVYVWTWGVRGRKNIVSTRTCHIDFAYDYPPQTYAICNFQILCIFVLFINWISNQRPTQTLNACQNCSMFSICLYMVFSHPASPAYYQPSYARSVCVCIYISPTSAFNLSNGNGNFTVRRQEKNICAFSYMNGVLLRWKLFINN